VNVTQFDTVGAVAGLGMIWGRIGLGMSGPFELQGHSIDIGASIGVAISPNHGATVESLMRAADLAMYRAKARGGGQHCRLRRDGGGILIVPIRGERGGSVRRRLYQHVGPGHGGRA